MSNRYYVVASKTQTYLWYCRRFTLSNFLSWWVSDEPNTNAIHSIYIHTKIHEYLGNARQPSAQYTQVRVHTRAHSHTKRQQRSMRCEQTQHLSSIEYELRRFLKAIRAVMLFHGCCLYALWHKYTYTDECARACGETLTPFISNSWHFKIFCMRIATIQRTSGNGRQRVRSMRVCVCVWEIER